LWEKHQAEVHGIKEAGIQKPERGKKKRTCKVPDPGRDRTWFRGGVPLWIRQGGTNAWKKPVDNHPKKKILLDRVERNWVEKKKKKILHRMSCLAEETSGGVGGG